MRVSHGLFHSIAVWFFHLGGFGLLLLGIIDSSPLSAPLANDLLVVALSASHPDRMIYYAVMAAIGSTLGCLITDIISRKAESKISQAVSSRRFKFVESQIRKHAAWTLALACLIPPPFPFTPFVAAAAATGYPRKKLLSIIAAVRFVRFFIEGALAVFYGRRILALAESPTVRYTVIVLIVVALGLRGFSIFRWIQKARSSRGAAPRKKKSR
jgi:membrane protein YqaA with SNARE-associated domain